MSRCIALMATFALVSSFAYAEEKKDVKKAPAAVVKVAPKVVVPTPAKAPVVVVPAPAPAPVAAPAPAPAKDVPAPAATASTAAAPAPAATAKSSSAVTNAPASAPATVTEAIDTAKQGVEFAKVRNWFGLSACIIFIVMFVLNAVKLFDKIGKRWAYIILPVLGIAAALCSRFAGGLSWEAAISVFTSAPVTGLLWDFVKRGILAKEPETPMKPVAAEAPTPAEPPK